MKLKIDLERTPNGITLHSNRLLPVRPIRVRGEDPVAGGASGHPATTQQWSCTCEGVMLSFSLFQPTQGTALLRASAHRGPSRLQVEFQTEDGRCLGRDFAALDEGLQKVVVSLLDPAHNWTKLDLGELGIQPHPGGLASNACATGPGGAVLALAEDSWNEYEEGSRRPTLRDFGIVHGPGSPVLGLIEQIKRVAASELPVVILGETGVGKELVAEAIHAAIQRSGPYIPLNCACLPSDDPRVIANDILGVGRHHGFAGIPPEGRIGILEKADKGTVLFDEIQALPLANQLMLLRPMDGYSFSPVSGDLREVKVRVKFVFASNRDLHEEVRARRFCEELHHRLKTFRIKVPPLRDRRADIPCLLDAFLQGRKPKWKWSKDLWLALLCYHWPGNVRELRALTTAVADACAEESGRISLQKLRDLPLDPGLVEGLHRAHCQYLAVSQRVVIADREQEVVSKLSELAQGLFPAAFQALAEGRTAYVDTLVDEALARFGSFLSARGFSGVAQGLRATCFELLKLCFRDESVVWNIVERTHEALRRFKVKYSCDQEQKRYGTFEAFFGVTYDQLRKRP